MNKTPLSTVLTHIVTGIILVVAAFTIFGLFFALGHIVGETKAEQRSMVSSNVCSKVFIPDNRFIVPWELKIEVPDGYKIYACKEAM